MVHTPRGRDNVRLAVATATALAGAGSLTAVGWLAGAAARQHHAEQVREYAAQTKADAAAAAAKAKYDEQLASWRLQQERPRVVFRNRPSRSVVRTQYQQGGPSVAIGGGTLSNAGPPSAPSGQPPTGPVPHSAPPPAPAPAPPPPPAPAPSSGS
jgi:hypothetical protein